MTELGAADLEYTAELRGGGLMVEVVEGGIVGVDKWEQSGLAELEPRGEVFGGGGSVLFAEDMIASLRVEIEMWWGVVSTLWRDGEATVGGMAAMAVMLLETWCW
jgi:hypothetical protein